MSDPGIVDEVAQAATFGTSAGGTFFFLRWLANLLTGIVDRRQTRLEKQEARADLEWQKIREELKGQIDALSTKLATVERHNSALRLSFNHVVGALVRVDPQNPAIMQAEQILSHAFPLDLTLLAEQAGAAVDATPGNH